MTVTCPEVTYISCLFLSLASALVGYLSPYWQVDKLSTNTEIAVGLNYACVKERKDGGTLNTYCKPLPTGAVPESSQLTISIARWLMTCHVLFMLTSCGLSLSSPTCIPKRKRARWAAAVFAVLATATGISGLSVVSSNISSYQHLFQLQFPELNSATAGTALGLGWSFYLSCAGCALFSLVGSVEMAVRARELWKTKQRERQRRHLLSDEIKIVYGSTPFLMDAISSGDQKANTITWPPVETACEIDMFKGGIVPVHDERRRFSKFIYPWKV